MNYRTLLSYALPCDCDRSNISTCKSETVLCGIEAVCVSCGKRGPAKQTSRDAIIAWNKRFHGREVEITEDIIINHVE